MMSPSELELQDEATDKPESKDQPEIDPHVDLAEALAQEDEGSEVHASDVSLRSIILQTIVLTAVEFGLLAALLRRPGFVLDRDALIDQVYRTPTVVLDRTVDSHVRKLRARLQAPGDGVIETVHGVGYRIGACLG